MRRYAYLVPEVDIVVEGVGALVAGAIVGDQGDVVEVVEVNAVDVAGGGHVDE